MHSEIKDIFTTVWLALRMNSARTMQGSKIKYKIGQAKEHIIIKQCAQAIKASNRIKHHECVLVLDRLIENPRENFIAFNKLMAE